MVWYLVPSLTHKFNLPCWPKERVVHFLCQLYMGRHTNSLAEVSVTHSPSILRRQVRTIDRNFPVATDPLLYFKVPIHWPAVYLLSNSTIRLSNKNYTFAQAIAYSSIFMASSDFHKLATYVTWVVLKGTESGQSRVHCSIPQIRPRRILGWRGQPDFF
jgi:hypothetical protein